MARTRSPLFDDLHDPRLADLVRASTAGTAAFATPLVASPRAAGVASSHRTERTPLRGIAPRGAVYGVGTTRFPTTGTVHRDPTIPPATYRTLGRLLVL